VYRVPVIVTILSPLTILCFDFGSEANWPCGQMPMLVSARLLYVQPTTAALNNLAGTLLGELYEPVCQGRFYVGAGGMCPPDSLVAPQIQKLADRSDVISEVPKCSKIQIFAVPPNNPPPLSAHQASFLQVSGSNPLQSWQPY